MSTTPELIQIVLFALVAGMAVPVLVQLFLTLRTLQRTSSAVERRVEETSRELKSLMVGLSPEGRGADGLGVLVSALAPAVVAAVRAFRATPAAEHVEPKTNNASNTQESTS